MKMPDTKEDGVADFLNSLFGLDTKRKKKRNLTWKSDLVECEIGDYLVVPLITSRQLRAEGRAMEHCVGNYDELCYRGLARVFSIRDLTGNRVATASLVWLDDYWHFEQLRGKKNAEALVCEETFFNGDSTVTEREPTELYFVGQDLLQRYRSAWAKRLRSYVCTLMQP